MGWNWRETDSGSGVRRTRGAEGKKISTLFWRGEVGVRGDEVERRGRTRQGHILLNRHRIRADESREPSPTLR